MTYQRLVSLQRSVWSKLSRVTLGVPGVHHRCTRGRTHARLSGWRHRQHLELHLKAPFRITRLPNDEHLVLAEPDQRLVREVHLLQVVQLRAVDEHPRPLTQVLDGEQHVRAVRGPVGLQGQLFAGHPGVEEGEGAGKVIPAQSEGIVCGMFAPGPQGKQLVKSLTMLLWVVDLHVETGQKVFLRLQCAGHAHHRKQSLQMMDKRGRSKRKTIPGGMQKIEIDVRKIFL